MHRVVALGQLLHQLLHFAVVVVAVVLTFSLTLNCLRGHGLFGRGARLVCVCRRLSTRHNGRRRIELCAQRLTCRGGVGVWHAGVAALDMLAQVDSRSACRYCHASLALLKLATSLMQLLEVDFEKGVGAVPMYVAPQQLLEHDVQHLKFVLKLELWTQVRVRLPEEEERLVEKVGVLLAAAELARQPGQLQLQLVQNLAHMLVLLAHLSQRTPHAVHHVCHDIQCRLYSHPDGALNLAEEARVEGGEERVVPPLRRDAFQAHNFSEHHIEDINLLLEARDEFTACVAQLVQVLLHASP